EKERFLRFFSPEKQTGRKSDIVQKKGFRCKKWQFRRPNGHFTTSKGIFTKKQSNRHTGWIDHKNTNLRQLEAPRPKPEKNNLNHAGSRDDSGCTRRQASFF
ncbi:MAG: hypothetical protein D6714_11610, partial [Bacteroidetes bacterium]